MNEIVYKPIGIVHSPFKEPRGTPIQSAAAGNVASTVELYPEFAEGLSGIEGFSHIILIYHFHLSKSPTLKVKPFLDDEMRGVFATRAPAHPNSIGISVVRLTSVDGRLLRVLDTDIVDRTPLLDIKPYVPDFDVWEAQSTGWLENKVGRLPDTKDDGRFLPGLF